LFNVTFYKELWLKGDRLMARSSG